MGEWMNKNKEDGWMTEKKKKSNKWITKQIIKWAWIVEMNELRMHGWMDGWKD